MGIARKADDVETYAYWSDVEAALKEICGLSVTEAATEVSEARLALSCLSEWGQLLAYHESVPQAAEDIWKERPGAEIGEEEVEEVRQQLIAWYAERNTGRGLPYGTAGSAVSESSG